MNPLSLRVPCDLCTDPPDAPHSVAGTSRNDRKAIAMASPTANGHRDSRDRQPDRDRDRDRDRERERRKSAGGGGGGGSFGGGPMMGGGPGSSSGGGGGGGGGGGSYWGSAAADPLALQVVAGLSQKARAKRDAPEDKRPRLRPGMTLYNGRFVVETDTVPAGPAGPASAPGYIGQGTFSTSALQSIPVTVTLHALVCCSLRRLL
jgi:hypothetical protein